MLPRLALYAIGAGLLMAGAVVTAATGLYVNHDWPLGLPWIVAGGAVIAVHHWQRPKGPRPQPPVIAIYRRQALPELGRGSELPQLPKGQ